MAKLGMQVAAAGLVGDDILGNAILERLQSAGLDTSNKPESCGRLLLGKRHTLTSVPA